MDTSSGYYCNWLCRTCLHEVPEVTPYEATTPKQQHCRSLFETILECESLTIAELLSSTVPKIKVNLWDQLPKIICCECVKHLQSFYFFQKMCLKSDQKMHDCIDFKHPLTPTKFSNDKISANEFSIQEINLEAKPFSTDHESTDKTPIEINLSTPDPLQSFDEPCNEIGSICRLSNDEPLPLTAMVIKEKIAVKTKKKRTNLVSYKHTCSLCSKSFIRAAYLNHHLKRHKRRDELNPLQKQQKLQIDVQCQKYIEQKICVNSKDKMEYYRFKCDVCNRHFHKPESLHIHRLGHDGKANEKISWFTCELCERTYSTRFTLARHKKVRHSQEHLRKVPKKYSCELCNKAFKSSAALADHTRKHTGERPYLCSECGKAYKSESSLKQHRLRHGDVKLFECPYCPKKFRSNNDVSTHKVIHDEIKRHTCDICGSSFGKSNQLKVHKMHHTGDKPHKCEYCEMRFVSMDHQRRHMRTHTGEKPYKCKYCERAFAQSNDLTKHLRIHLGVNIYRCELCPLAFRLASELRAHFTTHKSDDEETRKRNMKALREETAKLELKLSAIGIQKPD